MTTAEEAFLSLVAHRAPALLVETEWHVTRRKKLLAPVHHRLNDSASPAARKEIRRLLRDRALAEMRAFWTKHDGAALCIGPNAHFDEERPLLTLEPALRWAPLTASYTGEGEWAWTIDLCNVKKARALYRARNQWIVLATLGDGPACLTTFLDGPDTGKVFYLAPQARWNILVPVASSFAGLLERIAADIAAFLRHVAVTVCRASPRGEAHGLRPLAYMRRRTLVSTWADSHPLSLQNRPSRG